jgi:GTP-binding protein
MKFIDEAKVFIKSGDGGDGCLSFRREKFIEFGGPDGGNGGKGGDIFIKGTKSLNTLVDYRFQKHFKAKKGRHGSGRNRTGAAGQDITLKLPLGTEIFIENELIADVISTEKFLLFPGGKGGLGNINFKSSTNRAPRKITPGGKGKEAEVFFKLKLLADVGLVGLPNAGKSSLLRSISAAKPKVADYPFTTLEPKLGVIRIGDDEAVVADIPGLISGANSGSGLGIQFLKHIERCKSIIHMIDISAQDPIMDYKIIISELDGFDKSINKKEKIIILNKSDLLAEDEIQNIISKFSDLINYPLYVISTITRNGIENLKTNIVQFGRNNEL